MSHTDKRIVQSTQSKTRTTKGLETADLLVKKNMKGDPCFARDPVRGVFKAFGALLCRRLEVEWLNQSRYVGRIGRELLTNLPSYSTDGPETSKTWGRWRSYSNRDSAFASGQLAIAIEVVDLSIKYRLLDKGIAENCKKFFQLLSKLGKGEYSYQSSVLDGGLDSAYETTFDLAEIDPLPLDRKFVDRWSGVTIAQTGFQLQTKVSKDNIRGSVIEAALAVLRAMNQLEQALNEANNALEGKAVDGNVEPIIVRELLIAKFSEDAADLVSLLHESLKLTYKAGGKPGAITSAAVKVLMARMKAEVKLL